MASEAPLFSALPQQTFGQVINAQQLFLGQGGGIWIHEYSGRVRLFDGQHLIPGNKGMFGQPLPHLTYFEGVFWSFDRRDIIRLLPHREPQAVLTVSEPIHSIGQSQDWLWFSDRYNFYIYQPIEKRLTTFSLLEILASRGHDPIFIHDALQIDSQWVIATNCGLYITQGSLLRHIRHSGQRDIKRLHYSSQRNELFVATSSGLGLFSLEGPEFMAQYFPTPPVNAIAEVNNQYWLATDDGIFRFDTERQATAYLKLNMAPLASTQIKVHDIVSLGRGEVWIATDRGVYYHRETVRPLDPPHYLSQLTPVRLVNSQVLVNSQPVATNQAWAKPIRVEKGDRLEILIGAFPYRSEDSKYYRIGNDKPWLPLRWNQAISVDTSATDTGKIEIKLVSAFGKEQARQSLWLLVGRPWYLNPHFVMMVAGGLIAAAIIVAMRRSRHKKGEAICYRHARCTLEDGDSWIGGPQNNIVSDDLSSAQYIDMLNVLKSTPTGLSIPQQRWLAKVLKLIEVQCSEANFGTAQAAKRLFISERSLQRKFKQMTGSTMTEAVNKIRLARASQLLLEGSSVSDIAYQCGFNDPSYFSQKFKQQYGVTPRQFVSRQSHIDPSTQ
ncbi:helix-turn-helix domain-containing protein [Vibrio sp. WXL210]|uniref:helix-turn-helix transcriptional regulator n=1 Tax=Vibrio sp. WXL210 TaxID=3450709 RepID=UPI003EC59939